jgi:hypothetical protein
MTEQATQAAVQAEASAVLGILQTACERLHGLESKLENIANLGFRLQAVEDGQNEIKDKIDKSALAHQALQERYLDQSHKHDIQILEINGRLKNYEEVVRTVSNLEKKVSAYALIGVIGGGILGALFAGLPAWLERYSPQKNGVTIESVLTRDRR